MRNRQQNLYNVYVAGLFWGRIRNGCIAEFHCQPAVLSRTIKGAICKFWYSAYTVKLEGFRGPQYSEMPRHKLKKTTTISEVNTSDIYDRKHSEPNFFPHWLVKSNKQEMSVATLHYLYYKRRGMSPACLLQLPHPSGSLMHWKRLKFQDLNKNFVNC